MDDKIENKHAVSHFEELDSPDENTENNRFIKMWHKWRYYNLGR